MPNLKKDSKECAEDDWASKLLKCHETTGCLEMDIEDVSDGGRCELELKGDFYDVPFVC